VAGATQLYAISASQGVGAASVTALLAVSCLEGGASKPTWREAKLEGNSAGKGTADVVTHCSKPWALLPAVLASYCSTAHRHF
jgi:hypothetical protein